MERSFWYFIFYSFLGFLVETAFARAVRAPKRDRKCFYLLPLCPVYGLGALLILAPTPWLRPHPLFVAVWSALAATAAEYSMGLFYENALGVSFWDYTHLPWNLRGRICPLFSFFWCLLGLLTVYVIHPIAAAALGALPPWLLPAAAALLAADGAVTIRLLRKTGSTETLCWYRKISVPVLSNFRYNSKN